MRARRSQHRSTDINAHLPQSAPAIRISYVTTIAEVEKLAFDLPEDMRLILAEHLLASLSPVLNEADEGEAEAAQRDGEMDANPALGISLEELDRRIASRRG
jgi:hypothetical protein